MTDGVFVYDRHGSIMQVNTAARRLLALDVVPDYTARPLEERFALLDMRDIQGQSLPRGTSAPARLLKGEVLTGANALEVQVARSRWTGDAGEYRWCSFMEPGRTNNRRCHNLSGYVGTSSPGTT